ncbi:MAG TPA: DUF167 family protein [Actinomycetota bacterium]
MNVADALTAVDGGTEIRVFCQPRAARSALVGLHAGAVKVKVRAPALEGKANEALVGLLASALGVPVRRVRVVAGAQSRWKRVLVEGLASDLVSPLLASAVEASPSPASQ